MESETQQAKFAVEYFVKHVSAQIGAYAAQAGGIDVIVFTGGIGEKSSAIREMVCAPLAFMGFNLSEKANQAHQQFISQKTSKPVLVLEADEEAEIARLVSAYNI